MSAQVGKPAAPVVSRETATSKVEQALLLIARSGAIRSAEIAAGIGVEINSLGAMLGPDISRGVVVTASIISPETKRPTLEYRLAAGVDPATVLAERKARMVGPGRWARSLRQPRALDETQLPPRAREALAAEVPHPVAVNAAAPALRPDPLLMQAQAGRTVMTPFGRGATPSNPPQPPFCKGGSTPEVATSAVVASADANPAVPGPAGDPHCPAGTGSQQAEPPFSVTKSSSVQPAATAGVQAVPEEIPAAVASTAAAGVAALPEPARIALFAEAMGEGVAAQIGRIAEPLQFELKGELLDFASPAAMYALLEDGRLTIRNGDDVFLFGRDETRRLHRFLAGCAGLLTPSDVEQIDARR